MFNLFDAEEGTLLGQISKAQLRFLMDQLEETDSEDQDYYIDRATLEMLEEDDGDEELIEMLRDALGERDGLEVRWESEDQERELGP